MEIKRLYQPLSIDGEPMDRAAVLRSSHAKSVAEAIELRKRTAGLDQTAAQPSEIFKGLQALGHIRGLVERPVVRIRRLPSNGIQQIPTRTFEAGRAAGWLEYDPGAGRAVLHGVDGDVFFDVTHIPGRYCCHCGEKLEDDDHAPVPGTAAREHVAAKHIGVPSPSPDKWPAGYKCYRSYCFVLRA